MVVNDVAGHCLVRHQRGVPHSGQGSIIGMRICVSAKNHKSNGITVRKRVQKSGNSVNYILRTLRFVLGALFWSALEKASVGRRTGQNETAGTIATCHLGWRVPSPIC